MDGYVVEWPGKRYKDKASILALSGNDNTTTISGPSDIP